MRKRDVVRAWKDREFRRALADADALAPDNPAGSSELAEVELTFVLGGSDAHYVDLKTAVTMRTEHILTMGCCGGFTRETCGCSWFCPTGGTAGCGCPVTASTATCGCPMSGQPGCTHLGIIC